MIVISFPRSIKVVLDSSKTASKLSRVNTIALELFILSYGMPRISETLCRAPLFCVSDAGSDKIIPLHDPRDFSVPQVFNPYPSLSSARAREAVSMCASTLATFS